MEQTDPKVYGLFHFGIEIILFFIAAHRVYRNKTIIKQVYLSWISGCEEKKIYLFSSSAVTWFRPAYAAVKP